MKKSFLNIIRNLSAKIRVISAPTDAGLQSDSLSSLYNRYKSEAQKKIKEGKEGRLKLTPKNLWLSISENCNLRCVGCYMKGSFKNVYSDVEEVRKAIQIKGKVEQISFMSNESLLNPQFCDIIDLCREMHPDARLRIISNGTIPIKGRYKKAIAKLDKVALSIDGATKETYEGIRIGARFDNFIENTKEILRIREESGSPKEIIFAFTATATNLHELIDVVRLAHKLGLTGVWAQSMEALDDIIGDRISEIIIDRLEPSLRTQLIDEAKEEAARLGVEFDYSAGLYPVAAAQNEKSDINAADKELKSYYIKMCQYPWKMPVEVSKFDGKYVVRPCCMIHASKLKLLAEKYKLCFSEIKPADEIYNCEQLWQFREDLLNGATSDVCGDCDVARDYQWKPSKKI